MQPSPRQQTIYDTWQYTNQNIVVDSVAGSGKTTLLLHLIEHCVDDKTLYVAFNKSIQENMTAKMLARDLRRGKALTMHSLGFSAVRNAYSYTDVKNGDSKTYGLVKKVQDDYRHLFAKMDRKDSQKYFFGLMDLNNYSRLFLTDNIAELNIHTAKMGIVFNNEDPVLQKFWERLLEYREASYQGSAIEIDFTDMIYLPEKLNLSLPIDPVYLAVDEAQDLNLCQHKLIERLLNQESVKRFIAVGDRRQSIYGFSGAYSKSFDRFLEYDNTVELPLDICYRCDKSIVELANEVYDVMVPFSQEEGIVRISDSIREIEPGTLMLSRNNAPLMKAFVSLITNDIPCYIKGDNIVSGILKFAKPYRFRDIRTATKMMNEDFTTLSLSNNASKVELFNLQEKIDTFVILSRHFCPNINEKVDTFIQKAKRFFANVEQNGVALSTIHKAKGDEADKVWVINEDTIPSPYCTSDEELVQEENLRYVARTRAKHEHVFFQMEEELI